MPVARTKSNQDSPLAEPSETGLPEFVLRSSKEFLSSFQANLGEGGIFCPTRKKIPVGGHVVVKVRLGRRQPPVMLQGRVAWRRPGRHLQKIRAGIGIEFLPGERQKCDYLMKLAKGGESSKSRRRYERIPVDLNINWRPLGATDSIAGKLRDIGRGGAFVRTAAPVNGDVQVVLEIAPPGAEIPMAFTGRVAWTGRNGEEFGFGLEWRARDAGGGRRIKELVRRLSGSGATAAA
jgi:Tfp pilus assembly protein PilZ